MKKQFSQNLFLLESLNWNILLTQQMLITRPIGNLTYPYVNSLVKRGARNLIYVPFTLTNLTKLGLASSHLVFPQLSAYELTLQQKWFMSAQILCLHLNGTLSSSEKIPICPIIHSAGTVLHAGLTLRTRSVIWGNLGFWRHYLRQPFLLHCLCFSETASLKACVFGEFKSASSLVEFAGLSFYVGRGDWARKHISLLIKIKREREQTEAWRECRSQGRVLYLHLKDSPFFPRQVISRGWEEPTGSGR